MKIKLLSMMALTISLAISHSALAAPQMIGDHDEDQELGLVHVDMDADDKSDREGHGRVADRPNVSGDVQNAGSSSSHSKDWDKYDLMAIGLRFGDDIGPDWSATDIGRYVKEGILSTEPRQGAGISRYVVNTVTPQAVPLPGAFWLLSSGLLGLGFCGRKKRCVV